MAQNFIGCDRDQPFLLPPDVRAWLPEDHFAWFVIDAVGVMDRTPFYRAYRADGHGRAAYEPSMMIALLLYCWSREIRSSRAIERACLENVPCRVIAAQQRPDHATIARFIVRHQDALGELFGEVLTLCADAGLATDTAQAAAAGDRADELPEIVAVAEGRQAWRRAARQRLDQERAARREPIPRSRSRRLLGARQRLEEELAFERRGNEGYEAYRAQGRMKNGRRFGTPPQPYTPPDTPAGKINLTDLDSKLVYGMRGWVQGYNAQAACNEQHIILAADVMTASPDFGHLGPMFAAARHELARAGVTQTPTVVLADAGY